jgi:hypothetical protein
MAPKTSSERIVSSGGSKELASLVDNLDSFYFLILLFSTILLVAQRGQDSLAGPRGTQSMQDEVIPRIQLTGARDRLIGVLNAGVLCYAPGFVVNGSFTVPTG